MDESLKAGRFLHQLVILVSATMLFSVLSADQPSNDYGAALAELETARRTCPAIVQMTRTALTGYYERTGALKVLSDELGQAIVVESGRSEAAFEQMTEHLGGTALDYIYRTFLDFRTDRQLSVWDFDNDTLRRVARHAAGALGPRRGEIVISFDENPFDPRGPVNMFVRSAGYSVAWKRHNHISLKPAFELLVERGLIIPDRVGVLSLPKLRAVWELVGALDLESAQSALGRRERESKRSRDTDLSLFGLKVKASVAVVAAPAMLIALMLYMYAHVLHIERLAAGVPEPLSMFPWVALFDTKLAAVITCTSLWLWPVGVNLLLVAVAHPRLTTRVWVGILYTILLSGVTFPVLRGLARIRRKAGLRNQEKADFGAAA